MKPGGGSSRGALFALGLGLALGGGASCFSVQSAPAPASSPAAATVGPATLDFGLVGCGARGADQLVTISNTGGAALTWNASLGKGSTSPYKLSAQSGMLVGGATTQLAVMPADLPVPATLTPNAYGDTLTITTDVAGDMTHAIDLRETASGAAVSASTTMVTFGKQPLGQASAPSTLVLKNTGNAPATVNITATPQAYAAKPSSVTIAPGASQNVSLVFTPDAVGDEPGTIQLASSDASCGPLAAALAATGTGQLLATKVAAGRWHTCALVQGGRVACWGGNGAGQLGGGSSIPSSGSPTLVQGITGATDVGAGKEHSCALTSDGNVSCWGFGGDGEMGNGKLQSSPLPVQVASVAGASTLGVGVHAACAGVKGGAVWCWGGANTSGSFGKGTRAQIATPAAVAGVSAADELTVGERHACARVGGNAYCWGQGGQLGNGSGTDSPSAVQVTGISAAVALGTGYWHACALVQGGSAQCWGGGNEGELGNGMTSGSGTPVPVQVLTNVTSISGGYSQTCGVQGGQVYCWGQTDTLGVEPWPTDSNFTLTPTALGGIANAVGVGVGRLHACAVLSNGGVQCWGRNDSGQLGDGTANDSTGPVSVLHTGT